MEKPLIDFTCPSDRHLAATTFAGYAGIDVANVLQQKADATSMTAVITKLPAMKEWLPQCLYAFVEAGFCVGVVKAQEATGLRQFDIVNLGNPQGFEFSITIYQGDKTCLVEIRRPRALSPAQPA